MGRGGRKVGVTMGVLCVIFLARSFCCQDGLFSCASLLLSRRSVCCKCASSSSSSSSSCVLVLLVWRRKLLLLLLPSLFLTNFSFLEKLTSRGLKLCIFDHWLLCCCCCCLQCFFSFLGRVGCFLLVFCFVFF